ncbi:MAG: cysteine methyltransferase [Candidatus Microsaccharimonas sossegonensis]|uniref:Cysteine methyltransferase n=1 Tax=Candidatus Microsaccharimonas sossegonensis TaxID=2506948 RepID=A0A4Q0AHJ3_9BACT|nr:MAG: cysteine methyltransferase [Candidatus Microsaccharimonas sossegonensis]
MAELSSQFRKDVQALITKVPKGKVTTYGDLAAMAGHPYAARVVGGLAHYGDTELPWHRLVNRFGGLASGYYGGRELQEQHLLAEGISCTNFIVDNFKELRWLPG